MKKVCAMLLLLLSVTAFASDNSTANTTAHWNSIVGVITAPGVDNPVSKNIHSGTFAWSASSGNASVDLVTGNTSFAVQGLVINGTMFSGTQGKALVAETPHGPWVASVGPAGMGLAVTRSGPITAIMELAMTCARLGWPWDPTWKPKS